MLWGSYHHMLNCDRTLDYKTILDIRKFFVVFNLFSFEKHEPQLYVHCILLHHPKARDDNSLILLEPM